MSEKTVLDHGYVKLINAWGSEEEIVEAARMSTAKGFLGWESKVIDEVGGEEAIEHDRVDSIRQYMAAGNRVFVYDVERINAGKKHVCFEDSPAAAEYQTRHYTRRIVKEVVVGDERLLKYLYENRHMTPFEMAGATFEVKAPIFVFREWHRHRTQSYNEMSARYTPLPDENYVPTLERLMMGGGANKQAQSASNKALAEADAVTFRAQLCEVYAEAQSTYDTALHFGIPKELARLMLPVGRYSKMRASTDLRNWLAFMTLRCDSHAQWEIRQYANAVRDMLSEKFPRVVRLWGSKQS